MRSADRTNAEETLTSYGPGYRYQPYWSPDGAKLAFTDDSMTIRIYDRETKTTTRVDQDQWILHEELAETRFAWSADSRWLAYDRLMDNRKRAIWLYDAEDNRSHQATSGFYSDQSPAFDPAGEYLFFLTDRRFEPSYASLQPTWIYANTTQIAAVPLRQDVASPLAPRNDAEGDEAEDGDEDDVDADGDDGSDKSAGDKEEKEGEDAEPIEIDLEDFERRLVVLPPAAGNYADLWAADGKVVYRRLSRTGADDEAEPILFYDLKEREEETILENADAMF